MISARAEEALGYYCQRAKLGETQRQVLLLHLGEGLTAREIRPRLKFRRVAEVQVLIEVGLAKLAPLPGFREVLRQTVSPEQWRRRFDPEERELTLDDLMRGPRPAQAQTPFIGEMWTEVCRLPGTPKREGVPVVMAETVRRWW